MFTFGLVLGAGGDRASAFHAGVLATIASETGWDPRTAEVVIGTSAGAITAATLRSGMAAEDFQRRIAGEALSAEGQTLVDRIVTPYSGYGAGPTSKKPAQPWLVAKSMFGGFKPGIAYAGGVPRGTVDGSSTAHRIDELAGGEPWPRLPTWLCAVRLRDGKRIALGRDDVAAPSIGVAVQASSAVPGIYVPVTIGDDEFVDGAVHSTTNADLLAGLGLDGVIVSSPKSIAPSEANWKAEPSRTWYRRQLQSEIDKVQSTGIPVLAIEPDAAVLELMAGEDLDSVAVCEAAGEVTRATLDRSKKVAKRLQAGDSDEDQPDEDRDTEEGSDA